MFRGRCVAAISGDCRLSASESGWQLLLLSDLHGWLPRTAELLSNKLRLAEEQSVRTPHCPPSTMLHTLSLSKQCFKVNPWLSVFGLFLSVLIAIPLQSLKWLE